MSRPHRAVLGWALDADTVVAAHYAGAPPGPEAWRVERASLESALLKSPAMLAARLSDLAREAGVGPGARHVVTTALGRSPRFSTQREGVAFTLDAFAAAFPDTPVEYWAAGARFVDADEARETPHEVHGAGPLAAATLAATLATPGHTDALFLSVGEGDTDVLAVVGGRPHATGWTDVERSQSGERLPMGVLHSPAGALLDTVELDGLATPLAAAPVARLGDVHLWRGALDLADCAPLAPAGGSLTRDIAGLRLARLIGGDRELVDELSIGRIAAAVAEAQLARLEAALARTCAGVPAARTVLVAGLGEVIAAEAVRRAGLEPVRVSARFGRASARALPACAAAWLRSAAPTS